MFQRFFSKYYFSLRAPEKIGSGIGEILSYLGSTFQPTPFSSSESITKNGNTTKKILDPIPLK
jgi:hypothetical protein